MPEEILDKEAIGFLIRFFGGTASALTQNFFEWLYTTYPEMRGKFPFTRPIKQLPVYSDIIVGGISIAEALAGLGIEEDPLKVLEGMDFKTKEQLLEFGKGLRKFGEGGILYSAPMLTRTTIVKNIKPETAVAAKSEKEKPGQPTGQLGIVHKL